MQIAAVQGRQGAGNREREEREENLTLTFFLNRM
jgi:hypothetical protein